MPHPNSSAPIRILLQTVGTGRDPNPATDDPGNPVWNALAFAVKEIQPDRLVQFCSQKTQTETIPKFEQAVETCPADRDTHVTENEDDVGELTFEYGEYIDRLRQQFPDAEFHADFTSGTKAMSAALMAAALSREIANLHYATGPRDAGGRVTRTTALQKLHTGDLVAERKLDELGRLFDHGEFGAVRLQAGELVKTLERRALKLRAETLGRISEAYELWDRFDWKGAAAVLRAVTKRQREKQCYTEAGWNAETLERHHGHVHVCRTNRPTRERQADLLANVDRRLAKGQHDDAVTRLYRLTELLLQERFTSCVMPDRVESPNPTSRVPIERLKECAPRTTEELTSRNEKTKDKLDLGLSQTMRVLAEAEDPLAKQMWHDYTGGTWHFHRKTNGPFFQQLDARNNSWLAHGSTPSDEIIATALRNSVEKYLAAHFESQVEGESNTMRLPEYLTTIRFAKCPWG